MRRFSTSETEPPADDRRRAGDGQQSWRLTPTPAQHRSQRADPFAPLTSGTAFDVGDGHELYVESVGRTGRHPRGLPAWRSRQRLPARPPARCSIRSASTPCCSTSAAPAAAGPKGSRDAQHAAASDRGHGDDPREIRLRTLDGGRRLLGRDAGAGLCAGPSANASPVSCCARRFSAPALRSSIAFLNAPAAASIPRSTMIFSACCPPDERATAAGVLLAAHPRCRSRGARPGRARLG